MPVAADSSVVLDVLLDDPEFRAGSQVLLERHLGTGAVLLSSIAFAECATALRPTSEFARLAAEMGLTFDVLDPDTCALAAHQWRAYRAAGGPRRRILADFLIGAHAQTRTGVLLTRDRGFYRDYFTGLEIRSP